MSTTELITLLVIALVVVGIALIARRGQGGGS